ncbi:MAG: hypothetical protein AAGK78_05635, partial [Planctomycetota bacterium]
MTDVLTSFATPLSLFDTSPLAMMGSVWGVLHWGVLVAYVAILLTIALYGFHRYMLVWLYCKYRTNVHEAAELPKTLPYVTVQLPMFNEDVVAER